MIDIILSIMKELNMKLVTVIVECDSDGGDGYGSVNLMMNVMIEIQGDFFNWDPLKITSFFRLVQFRQVK